MPCNTLCRVAELDRDLEVQVNAVWRQLRSERADSLFGRSDAGSLPPARRWRPVLTALVGIVKRNANEAERQAQVGCSLSVKTSLLNTALTWDLSETMPAGS